MIRALFLCFAATWFWSCQIKEKPEFWDGQPNTLTIIIDDQLWNGAVGDSLRQKFATAVLGLSQEEPMFRISQYPLKLLEGFVNEGRNVLIVKKEPEALVVKQQKNQLPYNLIRLSGASSVEIIEQIEQHHNEITQLIQQSEIRCLQREFGSKPLVTTPLKQRFGVDITLPRSYKYALQESDFVWLKREITSGSTSLAVYEIPYVDSSQDLISAFIQARDSIGKKYIHGSKPGAYMTTEQSFSPYVSALMLDGRKAFEARGTWQMTADYMSGPFVAYIVPDAENQRCVVIEGFCYAPSQPQRDLMFEFEAIARSVKFLP